MLGGIRGETRRLLPESTPETKRKYPQAPSVDLCNYLFILLREAGIIVGASDAAEDLETGTIVTAPRGSTEEPL